MPILSDAELIKQWEKHKAYSEGGLSNQYDRAATNHAFYAGNQMQYVANVQDKNTRKMVIFNKVKPFVDAVSGFMIQLRRQASYQARIQSNVEQQERSEYLNALAQYARANANLDSLESRQDREMLIAGYGAIDTGVGYEKNPDGEVVAEVLKYTDVLWDPEAREPNLLDARWVGRVKPMALEDALILFDGSKEEDYEQYLDGQGENGQAYFNPGGGTYDKIIPSGGNQKEPLVAVYYYQWFHLEKYYRAKNPLRQLATQNPQLATALLEVLEFTKKQKLEGAEYEVVEDLFEFNPTAEYLIVTPEMKGEVDRVFEAFGVEVDYVEHKRRCYYTAVLSGRTIFKKFKSPDQQGFTIKFKTGNYDESEDVWFGMVDGLREPSLYANKALTEMLYVIASNSKGGVLFEESAVDDPRRFEQQYATTSAAIKVNDGALSGGKIQPKAQAALPSGYENIYAISTNSLNDVAGVNKEFLGASENKQVSGVLEAQRIQQVVTTLANFFDSIALYQIEHARLMITFLRILAENSEGRLIGILGEDGARKYVELSMDMMVDEYDVDITEAPVSPVQKQETARIMIEFAEKAAQFGKNIYPLAIDYIPNLKASDKAKIRQALQPTEDEVMLQQAQAQQAMADAQTSRDVQTALADAQKARAMRDMAEAEAKIQALPLEAQKAMAGIDKVQADIAEKLVNAEQKAIENELAKNATSVSVTI